jgi:hypothetical protein
MEPWSEFWREILGRTAAHAPRLLELGLVLGAHLGVAFLLRFLGFRLMKRFLGFLSRRDKREAPAGQAEATARTVSHALFWLVILSGLTGAMEYLGLPVLSLWSEQLNRVLPNWIAAAFIFFFFWIAGNFLRDAVFTSARSAGFAKPDWAGRYARWAALSLGALLAVSQAGLNVELLTYLLLVLIGTSLLGATLAFGLGAAPFVRSILAGHYIQKQFQVGDRVEIGNLRGRIQSLLPHAVILETDAGMVSIPSVHFHGEITSQPKPEARRE